jgi:formyltetrahydrofolate-dependent phosphoribosylglycinamide formyltransferase
MAEQLPRLAVFISGSGTNLQAIIDAINSGELKAQIALVISNRKAAYGLVRAEEAGLPTLYFPLKPYTDEGIGRTVYDADLAEKVRAANPDLLVFVGWMHVFSEAFLDQFAGKMINLHPALPGAFPGKDSIRDTFEAFQRGEVTQGGCMVHYIIPEIDAGEVIAQKVVPVEPADTLDTFAARMHDAEHKLIVESIRSVLENA